MCSLYLTLHCTRVQCSTTMLYIRCQRYAFLFTKTLGSFYRFTKFIFISSWSHLYCFLSLARVHVYLYIRTSCCWVCHSQGSPPVRVLLCFPSWPQLHRWSVGHSPAGSGAPVSPRDHCSIQDLCQTPMYMYVQVHECIIQYYIIFLTCYADTLLQCDLWTLCTDLWYKYNGENFHLSLSLSLSLPPSLPPSLSLSDAPKASSIHLHNGCTAVLLQSSFDGSAFDHTNIRLCRAPQHNNITTCTSEEVWDHFVT